MSSPVYATMVRPSSLMLATPETCVPGLMPVGCGRARDSVPDVSTNSPRKAVRGPRGWNHHYTRPASL